MTIKFKNRYTDEIIDMDIYENMSIDAQWDYDIIQTDSWDYDGRNVDTTNGDTVSGAEETDAD